MSRVARRPQAVTDLVEVATYIARDSPVAAERFLTRAEATIQRLSEMPGLGRPTHFLEDEFVGMRSWPIRGFPNYLVFYQETEGGIEIIRVLHGARDLAGIFADQVAELEDGD
jgi:toxin ParE1/3/4